MVRRSELKRFTDKRFRALIERSFDVIAVVDRHARVIYASPSIVRLYGRQPSEFAGIIGMRYVHPADFPNIAKLFASLILQPNKSIDTELRIKHRDGHWCFVHAIATNLLSDPEIRGVVINFHDITKSKELEARKDEFISIASHELKTPITTLKTYVQLLRRQLKEPASQYLEHMDTQLNRLTKLVNELLDVARIQEGKLELNKEMFDLAQVIDEVVKDLQYANTHTLKIKRDRTLMVYADKSHIIQVITNLITNAMKHSPTKSTIMITGTQKSDSIQVSVQDSGEGIAKENLHRIFDKYYQEQERPQQGLGLGLYISTEIIKQHGGEIWATSKLHKGSTFTFSLPRPIRYTTT